MNKSLFLLFAVLTLGLKVYSQKGLKVMDNGLQREVLCSCTDSFGNVLAVSAITNDSIVVNKFDITSRKWSFYATLGNIFTSIGIKGIMGPNQTGTCAYYKGKFYYIGNVWSIFNSNTYFRSVMYEFNGAWTKTTEFNETNYPSTVECAKFKNDLYLVGAFDSIGFTKTPNGVGIYNGSFFSSANFNGSIVLNSFGVSASFDISHDTLFLASGSVVYYHVQGPLTWGLYYDNPGGIESIACSRNYLYVLNGNKITILNNGSVTDTIVFINPNNSFNLGRGKLIGTKSNVLIKNYGTLFQLKNRKDIIPAYNFGIMDTSIRQNFLKFNDQQVYYHSIYGVINGSNNYHNIVEIELDSILNTSFDTLRLIAFRDYNKNYTKDIGEPGSSFAIFNINGGTFFSDNKGELRYYSLDNEDVEIIFEREGVVDTCYKISFSGSLKSKAYNSQINKSVLYFPLFRTSLQNRNLKVRSWGGFNERIADTVPIYIQILNHDCDQTISAADVELTLDNPTAFVSSFPNYISKKGNVYTFKLNTIYPNNDNIPIKVFITYPFGKYKIDDKVRHSVRIKTTFAEDTLDNTDSIVTKLVYSLDPNAKHCIPEGKVNSTVKKLRYRIDFQNEGTDVARNVIVIDTIDYRIPAYSFNIVSVSHRNYSVSIRDNIVTWEFKDINLQPKSSDELASKGFIIFEASLRSQLRTGDSVSNSAAIFFDYNSPVITNDAKVKVEESNGRNNTNGFYAKVNVFPNPTQAIFHFKNLEDKEQNLSLYDSKGALVGNIKLKAFELKWMDVSLWTKGIYMVLNSDGKGAKLIVQ